MRIPKNASPIITALMLLLGLAACNFNAPEAAQTPAPATPSASPAVPPASPTPALPPTLPPIITATPAPTATPGAVPTLPPTQAPTRPPATATAAPGIRILSFNMLDLKTGWSIGQSQTPTDDQILRTSDGGKTWKDLTPPDPARKGKKATAFFLDAKTAWVTFNPRTPALLDKLTLWRTTDAGATWKQAAVDLKGLTGDYFDPSELGFSDPSNGWLLAHMGAGMMKDYVGILRTADGGATWKVVVDPGKTSLVATGSKTGLAFVDAKTGFIAGDYNGVTAGLLFFQTLDNGATWKALTLPDPAGAAGIFKKDGMACGAAGLVFQTAQWGQLMVRCTDLTADKGYRWLYTTADGGKTWAANPLPGVWGSLFFLDMNSGWYLSNPSRDTTAGSKIYQTKDAGKTWAVISNVGWGGPLDFVDAKNGWVNAGGGGPAVLVRSADGGESWGLVNPVLAP